MNWQDMFTPETATPEDEALEAQYNADAERAQFMARINELHADLQSEQTWAEHYFKELTQLERAHENASAEAVDAIKRAEEAERELQILRERIANLALEGALVDGERRKQWYLERIMVECGAPVQAWHKRHQWQVGIAP